jgi:hypothetical protein
MPFLLIIPDNFDHVEQKISPARGGRLPAGYGVKAMKQL